jgi:DNA-binding CsgD family transcriptional regulator
MQQMGIQGEEGIFPALFADHPAHYLYTHYLACLVECSQRIYGIEENIAEQIAAEISLISHDAIQFYLHRQPASQEAMVPYVANRRPFPVKWAEKIYGSLQCKVSDESSEMILPVALCERLAQDCGWCLHLLEREASLQRKKQVGNEEASKKLRLLSHAQYNVLQLMVKGLSTRTIADSLHLSKRTIETHQRCIYQELDVHSQREAILVALAAGLSSF